MPTVKQIEEIEAIIRNAQKHKPDSKEAKKLYQRAIRLTNKYFKIPLPDEAIGEPRYDPDNKENGTTDPIKDKNGNGKGRVRIGPSGFIFNKKPSAIWLAAVKVHELLGHCKNGFRRQYVDPEELKKIDPTADPKKYYVIFPKIPRSEDEVISYNRMLEWSKKLGLTPKMITKIKELKKNFYQSMPKEKQKEWKKKEPWLAVRFNDKEFNDAIGHFLVPEGCVVFGQGGKSISIKKQENVSVLAQTLLEGSIREFLDLNPSFNIDLKDLRFLLFGPPEYLPVEASLKEKNSYEKLVLVNMPHIGSSRRKVN